MRITKNPEERRIEIIETANRLFETKGFSQTSVKDITEAMNVAKGTFYYYFESKNQVIDAIVEHALGDIVEKGEALVAMTDATAISRLRMILEGGLNSKETVKIRQDLHKPRNRELHEKMNVASIKALTPIISNIIYQGIDEGDFHLEAVEETTGFLLAGIQFYHDEMLFGWTEEELTKQRINTIKIIERCLGMKEGTLMKEEQS